MKTKLSSMLTLGAVLSLAGLAGPDVDAQVAAPQAPSAKAAAAKASAGKPAAAPPGAAPPAAPQPPAVRPGPRYSIDNLANTFSMDKTEKSSAGYVYWFFDKEFSGNGKTLKLSVVRPHEASHAPHHHVEDEFFYVLEGKAEFFIDGKTRIVGANTGMYAPSNVQHGIKNAGDTELKYLVIKEYGETPAAK